MLAVDSPAVDVILNAINNNSAEIKECIVKARDGLKQCVDSVSDKISQPEEKYPSDNPTPSVVQPPQAKISNLELIVKLGETEGRLQDAVCNVGSQMKNAASRIEGVENSMQAVQNVVNQFSTTLTQVKDKSVSLTDMEKVVKENVNTAEIKNLDKKIDEVNNNCKVLLSTRGSVSEQAGAKSEVEQKVDKLTSLVEKNTCDVKLADLDEMLWSLKDQIIAENQIIRKLIERKRKVRETYHCEFVIYNFTEKLEQKSRRMFSNVWFIDKCNSHIKINAAFDTDNKDKIEIWAVFGKYPKSLGLEPVNCNLNLNVSAKIICEPKRPWIIGKTSFSLIEHVVPWDCDGWAQSCGRVIGSFSAKKITKDGYLDGDKLHIRVDIT